MNQQVKVRPSAAAWRIIGRETILLNLDNSEYLSVNETGTALWPSMVDGATVDDLARVLIEAFGLEPQEAREDVAAFVEACRVQGILEE